MLGGEKKKKKSLINKLSYLEPILIIHIEIWVKKIYSQKNKLRITKFLLNKYQNRYNYLESV